MKQKIFQITATREAGRVIRGHTQSYHGHYDIAQHSYGATSLLLLLHPYPSLSLIKAVMWHDVGERWLGDLPSPAKSGDFNIQESYESAERNILSTLGFLPELTDEEKKWLIAVDLLDLWLWSREQAALGNMTVKQITENCSKAICGPGSRGPIEVYNFICAMENQPLERLSDVFTEAATNGLGKASE